MFYYVIYNEFYPPVASEDMLEQENQNMAENLSGKVARLKAVCKILNLYDILIDNYCSFLCRVGPTRGNMAHIMRTFLSSNLHDVFVLVCRGHPLYYTISSLAEIL